MCLDLLDQVCPSGDLTDPNELKEYRSKRPVIAGYNAASFYTTLYQLMKGGAIKDPKTIKGEVLNGNVRKFAPDVTRKSRLGTHDTEIKACSARSKHKLPKDQLRDYCWRLLKKLEQGEKRPSVDYTLFRYGSRDDYKPYEGLGKPGQEKNHSTLLKRLSQETTELTIIPLNVLIAMVATDHFHRLDVMDQSKSNYSRKDVNQICIYGGKLSALRKGQTEEELINLLTDDWSYVDHPNWLQLNQLKIKRYTLKDLPETFTCRQKGRGKRYPLVSFPITQIKINPEAEIKWLQSFRRNYKKILQEWIGIEKIKPSRTLELEPDF